MEIFGDLPGDLRLSWRALGDLLGESLVGVLARVRGEVLVAFSGVLVLLEVGVLDGDLVGVDVTAPPADFGCGEEWLTACCPWAREPVAPESDGEPVGGAWISGFPTGPGLAAIRLPG